MRSGRTGSVLPVVYERDSSSCGWHLSALTLPVWIRFWKRGTTAVPRFNPKSRFCQIKGFLRFAQVSLGALMRGKQYGRQPAAGSISLSCFTAFQSTGGSDQRLWPSNRRHRRCCRICNPTASKYPIIQYNSAPK